MGTAVSVDATGGVSGAVSIGAAGSVMDFRYQVLAMAWKIKRSLAVEVDLGDLYQAGWIGLLDAWQKFDSPSGVRFAAYARFRIRGAILDSLRQEDCFRQFSPRSRRMQAAQGLSLATSGTPSEQKVETASGEVEENVRCWHPARHLSIGLARLLDQSAEPFEQAMYRAELRGVIRSAGLNARQVRVLDLHYWNDFPLNSIGRILGVTGTRAGQIHAAALQKIKKVLTAGEAKRGAGLAWGSPC
ncbi:MAG TPA: sigma-70 family RNA polymerase sigma factor [Bryobacteraceae bacterium]|nr:sigma-70 family RNA polymerase sigma factor [Bryobacteraceae bacterium]